MAHAPNNLSLERTKKEARETAELEREALRLGIDIPRHASWWWDDSEQFRGVPSDQMEDLVSYYLTKQGRAGVRRLIREEKRKNIEWWLKVVGSVITLITGLVGTLIGLFAVLRN